MGVQTATGVERVVAQQTATGDTLASLPNVTRSRAAGAVDAYGAVPPANKFVRVLYVNDVHGRYDMLAAIATLVQRIRKAEERVLLVCAGDNGAGTIMFEFDGGELGLRILDQMDAKAFTIGNHEANAGVEAFQRVIAQKRIKMLSANLDEHASALPFDPNIHAYTIENVAGLRVGIFGLTTPDAPHPDDPRVRLAHRHIRQSAQAAIDEMRGLAEPPDVIFCLSHLGKKLDEALAPQLQGCHAIIGGHSHDSVQDCQAQFDLEGRPVIVAQAGAWGEYLGDLSMTLTDDGRVDLKRSAVTLHDIKQMIATGELVPDPTIVAMIDRAMQPIRAWERTRVVDRGPHIEADSSVRRRENHLANIAADAMLEQTKKHADVDVALLNAGNIRGSLPAGPWTNAIIASALAYTTKVGIAKLTAPRLREVLETSVAGFPTGGGEGLQSTGALLTPAGMRYHFDIDREPGQRITGIEVRKNGKWVQLRDSDTVRVAVCEYIYNGGWGYSFAEWRERGESEWVTLADGNSYRLRDMFTDYLRTRPKGIVEASPRPDAPRMNGGETYERWLAAIDQAKETLQPTPTEARAGIAPRFTQLAPEALRQIADEIGAHTDSYRDCHIDALLTGLEHVHRRSRLPLLRAVRNGILDAADIAHVLAYRAVMEEHGIDVRDMHIDLHADSKRVYVVVDTEHTLLPNHRAPFDSAVHTVVPLLAKELTDDSVWVRAQDIGGFGYEADGSPQMIVTRRLRNTLPSSPSSSRAGTPAPRTATTNRADTSVR